MEVPNDLWCGTLSYLENVCGHRCTCCSSTLTKMNVAVRQLVGISTEKRVQRSPIVRDDCGCFCRFIDLQNRDGRVVAGRSTWGATANVRRKHAIITIIKET